MDTTRDIAIVGMSGLFARAPDVQSFWSNILNKVDGIGEPGADWIGDPDFFDATAPREKTRLYTRSGGFLNELARFDAKAFGTMPLAVVGGDPDQFLALKGAADALEDAGYAKGGFNTERTGIILGHTSMPTRGSVSAYQHAVIIGQMLKLVKAILPEASDDGLRQLEELLHSKLPRLNVDAAPGLVPNVMTGRIANRLDLMGPNYLVDAACASSLLAIEAACTELRLGRADVMLAGGVNSTTTPLVYAVFCQLEALSRRSRIRPFDRAADGTLLGEGQGVVVLKRLEDALKAGDRIYAVIKGVGSSSDGRAMGLMAPRLEGEILAMKNAYRQTGIDPATIGLFEAHGTGIPLGDRTEVQALRTVMGNRERPYPHIALGSVKSMIGHCIPAAGVAALIKMAMALHHKILPPTLVEEVSPDLGIENTCFYVNTEVAPWIHPGTYPRRAGINSFGFGGVNAHMILEEAPGKSVAVDPGAAFGFRLAGKPCLFTFAAATRETLIASLRSLKDRLAAEPIADLARLAGSLVADAAAGNHRLAIVAASGDELAKKLQQAIAKLADAGTHRFQSRNGIYFTDRPYGGKVAFLFPGENSQYAGMLKDLAVSSPMVREWFDQLEGLFGAQRDIPHRFLLFPPPNSLSEEERDRMEKRLRQVDAGSESVFFADQAIFTLLSHLGVKPDFIVGHSNGENAGLIASKLVVLTRDQLGGFIGEMNKIYSLLEDDGAFATGTLLTVGALPRPALLATLKGRDNVWLTMDNCPNQAIVFGPEATMEEIAEELTQAGAICMKLPLSWAYHTPLIAPMAEKLRTVFDNAKLGPPIAKLYSCATAAPFPNSDAEIRDAVISQYVSPVNFMEVIELLYQEGARTLYRSRSQQRLDRLRSRHPAQSAFRRPGERFPKLGAFTQIHHLAAQIFVEDSAIDLSAIHPPKSEAVRRNEARLETFFKTPPLPCDLPFLEISTQEGAELRNAMGLFGTVAGAAASNQPAAPRPNGGGASTKAPAASSYFPAASDSPPSGRANRASEAVLSANFDLMTSFLKQQQEVTATILGQTLPPLAHDLSPAFQLPFASQVHVAGWGEEQVVSPDPIILTQLARSVLSEREFHFWSSAIAGRHPRRQREWLLGRVAAKTSARSWLARLDRVGLDLRQIEVLYGSNRQPFIALANGALQGIQPPRVSVSHADGIAVAACSEQAIGIDIDGPERVRDPDGIARIAFCEAERALLAERFGEHAREATALLWSIKEAAAKVSGQWPAGAGALSSAARTERRRSIRARRMRGRSNAHRGSPHRRTLLQRCVPRLTGGHQISVNAASFSSSSSPAARNATSASPPVGKCVV